MKKRRRRVKPWQPDNGEPAGQQRRFLVELKDCFEVLNAGSVGGGKTDAGLMGAVTYPEYRRSPSFKALILRYAVKDLATEFYQRVLRPSMWPSYVGGSINETKGVYRFSSGGRAIFTSSRELRSLQGPEFQYVWFDELTHWPDEKDYLYVAFTRCRSATGLPIRIRAGTNPGGPGHEWVKRRWGPWLAADYLGQGHDGQDLYGGAASLRALGKQERRGPNGRLPPCESGEVLHFTLDEDGREEWCAPGTPNALTRSCLRTKTSDNLAMAAKDPGYAYRVRAPGGALVEQLAKDNWDASAQEGDMFQRACWHIIEAVPALEGILSWWDLAYTAPPGASARRKRDYSTRVKLGWRGPAHDRWWYLLHVLRTKEGPAALRELMKATAAMDGREVPILVPIDYAAGNWVVADLIAALAGFQVLGVREHGKKEVRIATLAPQVRVSVPPEERRIKLLRGGWIPEFLDEAAAYPNGRHDDQLDGLAGAFLWSLEGSAGPSPEQALADLQNAAEASAELSRSLYAGAGDAGAAGVWGSGWGMDPDRI